MHFLQYSYNNIQVVAVASISRDLLVMSTLSLPLYFINFDLLALVISLPLLSVSELSVATKPQNPSEIALLQL